MAYYPDISHWKPVKDWATVKKNCGFLISKATQGTNYIDPTLKSFIKGCESKGIPYWLYTFLNRGSEKAQAQYMVKVCKPLVGKYFRGYVLDVESNNTASGVKAALDYLKSLGGKSMIYTMYSQYSKYKSVISGRGSSVAWWEARYGANNGSYSSKYPCHSGVDLHQYTSRGSVPGIGSSVDLNRVAGSKKLAWFTGSTPKPTPTPTPTPTPPKPTPKALTFTYAVKAGGKYYPGVTNLTDYAGVRGKAITDVAIKVNKGKVKYRVHVKGGKWLPYVTGYSWKNHKNGYAGNGKPIDALQVILSGVTGKVATYRVSPVNGNYYSWQKNAQTSGAQDGYAGAFGKTIDRIQIH